MEKKERRRSTRRERLFLVLMKSDKGVIQGERCDKFNLKASC